MTRATNEDSTIINRGSLSSVWKTESGYTTLGILANIAIVLAVTVSVYLSGGSSTIGSKVLSGTCAASFIVAGLYLLTIYRSYYSSKPIVRSCKIASFLNGFLGAGLFGLLWNRLLTKSKGGDSAGVLGAIALLLWAAFIVFNIYTITNYQPKPITSQTDSRLSNSDGSYQRMDLVYDGYTYTDDDTGATFDVPSGWVKDEQSGGVVFTSIDDTAETLFLDPYDIWSSLDNKDSISRDAINQEIYTEDFFAGLSSDYLTDCKDEIVSSETIGSYDYFVVTGSGYTKGGTKVQMKYCAHIENGYAYQWVFFKYADSKSQDRASDYISMIESAKY